MIQEEVESQLSAMFDGELPAAECELLSRRIDRDDRLRARWSRYALIGAAMRSEPVATAPSGFASRVSAALDVANAKPQSRLRRGRTSQRVVTGALAAGLIAAVAGLSITLLRSSVPALTAYVPISKSVPSGVASGQSRFASTTAAAGETHGAEFGVAAGGDEREPVSYVTPTDHGADATALRTELADYIVAHSEYSTPLMRRNLLSALVSSGDEVSVPELGRTTDVPRAAAGGADATSSSSYSQH